MAQEVVDQQPVEPPAGPLLVADVVDGVHLAQLGQVGDPRVDLLVQPGLLVGVRAELALQAPHLGEHGVEVLEHILGRALAVERGGGRVFEECLDLGRLFLDRPVGRAEVLAEELVREAEERLVLHGSGLATPR